VHLVIVSSLLRISRYVRTSAVESKAESSVRTHTYRRLCYILLLTKMDRKLTASEHDATNNSIILGDYLLHNEQPSIPSLPS
jgi:hypothetical protein